MPRKTNETIDKRKKVENSVTKRKTNKENKKTATKSSVKNNKTITKKKASKLTTNAKSTKRKTPSKSVKGNSAKNVKSKINQENIEYYDLPYRYGQTTVKILAQTPNTLFVYWEISDVDRKKYIEKYGENFFDETTPILIVHNRTYNYSFEIEVNDFANSWYFNINDSNSIYELEFGRKLKSQSNIEISNNYVQIISSNKIEAPNDHILFDKERKNVFFRNVKTNQSYSKDIINLDFMKKIGTIYNIYDVYKKIYKIENLDEIKNPSSY